MRRIANRAGGQTGTEYMLAISVIVISVFAAFYLVVGQKGSGPAATAFANVRDTIELPYP